LGFAPDGQRLGREFTDPGERLGERADVFFVQTHLGQFHVIEPRRYVTVDEHALDGVTQLAQVGRQRA
jgi:hypothetical protein